MIILSIKLVRILDICKLQNKNIVLVPKPVLTFSIYSAYFTALAVNHQARWSTLTCS
jgi:hypothetical protein